MPMKAKQKKRMSKGLKKFLLGSLVLTVISISIPYLILFLDRLFALKRQIGFKESYIILAFIGVLVMFFIHSRKKILALSDYKTDALKSFLYGCIAAILFVLFYASLHAVVDDKQLYFVGVILFLQLILALAFLFLAVFGMDFVKKFYRELMLTFLLFVLFTVSSLTISANWSAFAATNARMNYAVLSLFSDEISIAPGASGATLALGNFTALIGSPCSGIESLTMFLLVALFIVMLDWSILNHKKLWILIPGILGMYIVGVLRVLLLMIVGTKNPALAIGLFHTNVGWILFAAYLLLFWNFVYPWLKKK